MRILLLHNRYRGGEDVAAIADTGLLEAAGHEVVPLLVDNPTSAGATAVSLARAPWNTSARRDVRQVIAEARPDIVHAHNVWFALGPAVLREPWTAGVPLVLTVHNYRLVCAQGGLLRDGRVCEDCVGTHPWRGVLHRCYRDSVTASLASALTIATHRTVRTWDRATTFLAPSTFLRDRLITGGVRPDQIRVRANHTADPGDRPAPPSASSTVIFVGRLADEKGVDQVLDAWRLAPPPGLELVIVGDGPLRLELEARAGPGVRFTGRLPPAEVAAMMASSRALVVPSRWYEVAPLVLIEALGWGLPAVVTGYDALPGMMGDESEFVVDPDGGPTAWAEALGGLVDDDLVDGGGRRARARYLERHSPEVALASLLDTYEKALAKR